MKRLLSLLLTFLLILTMASCGNSEIDSPPIDDESISETQEQDATVDISESNNELAENAKEIASEYLVSVEIQKDKDGNIIRITNYTYNDHFLPSEENVEQFSPSDSSYYMSAWFRLDYSYDNYDRVTQVNLMTKEYWEYENYTKDEDWSDWSCIKEYSYDSSGSSTLSEYWLDGKLDSKTIYSEDNLALFSKNFSEDGTEYMTTYYDYNDNGDLISDKSYHEREGQTKVTEILYEYDYTPFGLKEKRTKITGDHSYEIYEYDDNYCLVKSTSYLKNGELDGWVEYEYIKKEDIYAATNGEEQEVEDTQNEEDVVYSQAKYDEESNELYDFDMDGIIFTQEEVFGDFITEYLGLENEDEINYVLFNLGVELENPGMELFNPASKQNEGFMVYAVHYQNDTYERFAMQASDPQIPEVYRVNNNEAVLIWKASPDEYYREYDWGF